MTRYYVCFAIGQADSMPDQQFYHTAESVAELVEICLEHIKAFRRDNPRAHYHMIPAAVRMNLMQSPDASALHWRLAIASDSDCVLDVIGMTAATWRDQLRESSR
jgi:hypothetical protein